MNRDLYEVLCQWKRGANRRPLLVRGVRQVGKTYLVDEFGKREFILLSLYSLESFIRKNMLLGDTVNA